MGDLVELGEGRLNEPGGHADSGHHPHPEHGTGTTHGDGDGYADNIPGTDPGGQADREGLEGGDPALLAATEEVMARTM